MWCSGAGEASPRRYSFHHGQGLDLNYLLGLPLEQAPLLPGPFDQLYDSDWIQRWDGLLQRVSLGFRLAFHWLVCKRFGRLKCGRPFLAARAVPRVIRMPRKYIGEFR